MLSVDEPEDRLPAWVGPREPVEPAAPSPLSRRRWQIAAGGTAAAALVALALWHRPPIPVAATTATAANVASTGTSASTAATSTAGTATEVPAPATPPISTYTVKSGDTLWSIALQFGTDVPSLEAANHLTQTSVIRPGQKLTVLNQVGWIYTVAAGQGLSAVAAAGGISLSSLETANNLAASAVLQTGQRLVIPVEPSAAQVGATAAADAAPAKPAATWVVQAGNTLSAIASSEGISLSALEAANGLSGSSVLSIGQQLLVPGSGSGSAGTANTTRSYVVQAGNTLSAIASTEGVTLSALEAANGLSGSSILRIGQTLTVPGAGTGGTSGIRLSWPVPTLYPITSPFGWRKNPWGGSGMDFHHGIDIGVPLLTPVHAACSGTVTVAQWVTGFRGGYGNAVEILCNLGPLTLYAHNTRLVVQRGEQVSRGQLISYSGSTGNSTGPHLHFGVQVRGVWQNPMNYLPPR